MRPAGAEFRDAQVEDQSKPLAERRAVTGGALGGGGGRHLGDRVFGQRGDRQARVDTWVGGQRRAVGDQQVLVAEYLAAGVDDALGGGAGDDRAAEDVRGRRHVEQRLGGSALRGAADTLG